MSVFDQRLSGAISGGSGPEREEPVRREKRKKEPRPEKKKEKQVMTMTIRIINMD